MKAKVNNVERTITKADVVAESIKPFAANVVEGQLVTGETFRCWASPEQWAVFMAG